MSTACPRCGHENPDDALLCGTCRAYLGWARRRGGEAAREDVPPPHVPPTPHPPAPADLPPAPHSPADPPPADPPAAPRSPAPADPPPARTARGPAPPAPITVPQDRSGAPRAVRVPASGTPRPPGPPGPVSPAVPRTPPTAGTADATTGTADTGTRANAGTGTRTSAGTGTAPDAPDAPTHGAATSPAAAPGPERHGTGRSTWSPPVTSPSPSRAAPARPAPPGGPAPVQVVLGPSAPRPARPDARTPPPRSIGVRVAAGPARVDPQRPADREVAATPRTSSFEALQPTAAHDEELPARTGATTRAGPRSAAPAPPVFEEAVRCPACRRALPVSRRFCRCGATLDPPARLTEDDAPAPAPWYRRAVGAGASFRRRMRAANHGARVVFDRGRGAQVHVARATAALAAVGLAGVIVLPQTADVRDRAAAVVQQVDPRGYTRVTGVTATTDPPPSAEPATDPAADAAADTAAGTAADPAADPGAAAAPDPAFGPQHAVDGATGRAWSAPWTGHGDAGPRCERPGGAPTLVLTLPAPTDVDRIGVVAGLPESAPDRPRQAVPALVDVTWLPSGRCTTLELADATHLQTQDVDARGVTSVELVVVDVHLPQDPPPDLRVALAEVVLLVHGDLALG